MTFARIWGVAGMLLLASGCSAFAQDSAKKFISEAIQGNLAEVSMGQLARSKGQSEGARAFGRTLETDHTAAIDQATAAATEVGALVPTEPSAKQKRTYEMMSKLSGPRFDREFIDQMVEDHKVDISKYTKQASGSGPVAKYAKATLPMLKQHLDTAQSLQEQSVSSLAQ